VIEQRAYSRLETDAEFALRLATADKKDRRVHIMAGGLSAMDRDALDHYGWATHKMQRRIVWVD
jgi:hypothetical protein